MINQDVEHIKQNLHRQEEFMQTRSDMTPRQILEVIEFLEGENRQLSLQVVNLTASKKS